MGRPKKYQATIIDVAKLSGFSKSTVGRALSDASNVNPETRTLVQKAAAELGYERNHLAHSLRSGRSGMLGLVIPDIANPFWAEVARGAQDKAAQMGASLLIFSSDWDSDREASHLRALRQARVDGVIVNPVENRFDDLAGFGMPAVLIGSSAERYPELPSVGSDIVQGIKFGLDHLNSLGHVQPVFLLGPYGRLARVKFQRAVHDYYVAQGVDPDSFLVEQGDYTVASGKAAMKRILVAKPERPLCLFAANDLMALGALLAVRDAGLTCPDDVSILGFDGIMAGDFSYPGLTTIAKPARGIGDRAMTLLLDQLSGDETNERVVLPCQLVSRGSLMDLSKTETSKLTTIG